MKYVNEKLEEFNNYIKNKKIAIIGLETNNIDLIEYLYNLKANIIIFNNKMLEDKVLDKIYEYGIEYSCGENYLSKLKNFDIILRNSSCRPDLPEIKSEVERGALLTSEVELILELFPGTTIGVTGSKGRKETSTLIYEILKEDNLDCYLERNNETTIFSKITNIKPNDYMVLELNSNQLMTINTSPNIAVITDISESFEDSYNSYEEYIQSKENIFKYQKENDFLVLNYDNEIAREFSKVAESKIICFSTKEKIDDGIIVDNGIIKKCENGLRRHIVNVKEIKNKEANKIENICAAIAATSKIAQTDAQIRAISNKDY